MFPCCFRETETSAFRAVPNKASPEEMPSTDFEKELFLEEIRKYRCLWDTNSEGYKSRPIKQNAWSKLSQLFNKDGKYQHM